MKYYKILTFFVVFSCFFSVENSFASNASNVNKASYTDRLHQHLNDLNSHSGTKNQFVTVILEADKLDGTAEQLLTAFSAQKRFSFGRRHEIKVPAGKMLSLLNRLPNSIHARLPYPHQAVAVTSQGVGIAGADDMQALGNGGEGVKVGIIDLGFLSYATAQSTGDLPANLTITDYTDTGTGGINHGTNVAEIVHDMAPGAELYLAKVATSLQLEQAMNDMLSAGVKIINHSVAWFGAAFYDGTGPICAITDNAEASGISWINAMGNSRAAHYLGTFADVDSDLRHEFSSGQNTNTISLNAGSSYTLILNWDAYPTTAIDYNLYLYNGDPDAGGSLVASSTNRQTGRSSPYEAITYTAAITATHYIVITKGSGDTNVPLTLFSTGPNLVTRTTASSVTQPADCNSVISVGATNLTDGVEWFSSEGPTTDGRFKPEISAPNRTVTSLSSSFTGTSGASPHVAGAAALLLAQNLTLTTTQIRDLLISDSHDVNTTGFDYRTGYGRLSLDADLDSVNHDDDNCVLVANIDQLDLDVDGLGNVCDLDIDGDGLTNTNENSIGTDPYIVDTDADGLTDGDEVNVYFINPLLADTDADGLIDGDEVLSYATDPSVSNIGDLAPRYATDNSVHTADLLILFRLIEQLESPTTYESAVADINSDGVLDIRDALKLRQDLGL